MNWKLVLGILLSASLVIALIVASLKIMITPSDPGWLNVAIGIGFLVVDFIFARTVVGKLFTKIQK